ncbi:18404_t:CDS:2, partial [Gigaspora rosea]
DELISKCKTLVSILSKEKKKQLCEAQLQVTPGLKEPLDVIKDVDTRWNSIFHLIEQLVHLRPAIMQLYSTLNNHTLREIRKSAETLSSFLPSEEEFELLEELVTLGFMTPMLEELTLRLKYFTGQNEEVISVSNMILDNLIERWGDLSEIGMCCSLLDPRFKQLNFCTRDLRCSTIQLMRHQFDELNSTQTNNNDSTQTNNVNTISHQHKKPKLSAFFLIYEQKTPTMYLMNLIEPCPLVWRRNHKTFFSTLAILARRYLAVPASSVPSERLFSDAENH